MRWRFVRGSTFRQTGAGGRIFSRMQIILNGDPRTVADGATVASLIEQLDLAGKRLAVEVNEEVVPRSRHSECPLASGDQVEIVHAIGGG